MKHMRLRHIQGAEETIASSPFVIQEPEHHRGTWNQVFGNSHPLEIEVGMGKGRFIMEKASASPDINYIGIERYSSVLLRGLQKRSEMDLENIYFMCIDAKDMAEIFAPGEVDRIYLNFSDPWPKDRHAKHPLSLCLYTTKFWRPGVLLNSRQITAGCLNIPWNPFQMPAGRLQSIPLIFTTAPWQKAM
jgi:tRNA G46 methylase TrmB